MAVITAGSALSARLAESLYTEALVLADDMRGYFDGPGRAECETLDPHGRVRFACESLKGTTRLMHVIGWLATRRAIDTGEMAEGDVRGADRCLPDAAASDPATLGALPSTARQLILGGIDLYDRVGRLAAGMRTSVAPPSPARILLQRLERAF